MPTIRKSPSTWPADTEVAEDPLVSACQLAAITPTGTRTPEACSVATTELLVRTRDLARDATRTWRCSCVDFHRRPSSGTHRPRRGGGRRTKPGRYALLLARGLGAGVASTRGRAAASGGASSDRPDRCSDPQQHHQCHHPTATTPPSATMNAPARATANVICRHQQRQPAIRHPVREPHDRARTTLAELPAGVRPPARLKQIRGTR